MCIVCALHGHMFTRRSQKIGCHFLAIPSAWFLLTRHLLFRSVSAKDQPVSASSELEVQVCGTIPDASVGILRIWAHVFMPASQILHQLSSSCGFCLWLAIYPSLFAALNGSACCLWIAHNALLLPWIDTGLLIWSSVSHGSIVLDQGYLHEAWLLTIFLKIGFIKGVTKHGFSGTYSLMETPSMTPAMTLLSSDPQALWLWSLGSTSAVLWVTEKPSSPSQALETTLGGSAKLNPWVCAEKAWHTKVIWTKPGFNESGKLLGFLWQVAYLEM